MNGVRLAWLFFSILFMVYIYAEDQISPYDIPDKKELDSCSCVENTEYKNYYDPDEPFFITLTVANFGEDVLENVRVSIYPGTVCVVYLSDTSEISRRKDFSQEHSWEKVPDNLSEEGLITETFPFTENYSLTETLAPCKDEFSNCENIMIRFQHHVHGGCPKYYAEFQATISDDSGKSYRTNSSYPLKLNPGDSSDSECYIAPQDQCGGHSFTRPDDVPDEDAFEHDEDIDEKESDGCSAVLI